MNIQFLRDMLYSMKLNYGKPGQIYKIESEHTDSSIGVRTVVATVTSVRRMVILPSSVVRKFFYDLAYMKANNAFTYGGDVPITSTIVVIDWRDSPKNVVEIENHILMSGDRYTISKVENIADVFYLVGMSRVEGSVDYDIKNIAASSTLRLGGGA